MAITFHNENTTFLPAQRRRIVSWIKEVIASENRRVGDIAYIFCSSDYHIEVNRNYLQHDYNTDVITFDYSDRDAGIVSGDIFIDPATVRDNSDIVSTDPAEELMRVIVHGVLHLCGYNDKTSEEEKLMRDLEDRSLSLYMRSYGNFPPFVMASERSGL